MTFNKFREKLFTYFLVAGGVGFGIWKSYEWYIMGRYMAAAFLLFVIVLLLIMPNNKKEVNEEKDKEEQE